MSQMQRHRKKTRRSPSRRALQKAEPPPVPVVVAGPERARDHKSITEENGSTPEPEPLDERIRRMIEAAYT